MDRKAGKLDKGNELFNAFIKVAPYLNNIIHEDIVVGIYDTEKMLLNIPGKTLSIRRNKSEQLKDNPLAYEAFRKNKEITKVIPKELHGHALIDKAIPVQNKKGDPIGVVLIATSMDKINSIYEIAASISAAMEQTAATVQDMASQINGFTSNMKNIATQAKEVGYSVGEIESIASTVKKLLIRVMY